MRTNYYKKSGLVMMNIARDLFSLENGDRLPTILEYTEKFQVSRGIVQNALSVLENNGCIVTEKRGVKGTFLLYADPVKLYPYTNFGSITGTMPVPLTSFFSSLTTAVCEQMEQAPFPFCFAYVSGSEKRLEMMQEQMYDFMIVSQYTAKEYIKKYDFISQCMILQDCIYAQPFSLYFFDKTKKTIEDGMRVGIDMTSIDQREITKALCKGKRVNIIEIPIISFEDMICTKNLDCVVYRSLEWRNVKLDDLNECPLPGNLESIPLKETQVPVILTNKENYGIEKLLQKYISNEKIKKVQSEVLAGKRAVKFY